MKAAQAVHSYCGPGLLESAYQECLKDELKQSGLRVDTEISMPLQYKNRLLYKGYVINLLVERKLIVELRSVEKLQPVHMDQVKTYLKFSNLKEGLLINFNSENLSEGIVRITNDSYQ